MERETSMDDKEFEYLVSHPEIEKKYAGEYIAIVGSRVVAHGKDFKKVLEEAEKKTGKKPLIHKAHPWDKELVV